MIQKIVLYGSGKRCKVLCKILLQSNIEIVRIVDTDSNKWGDKIEGFEVENPDIIERLLSENLCITVADVDAIKQIRDKIQSKYKYDLNKEIHYHQLILEAYKHCLALKKHIMGRAINTGRKQSILFDCYNGLILGGVEAWTMELCKELINDGRKHIYIISDEGNYHVPLILGNHIVYADINHEEQFSIKSILNLVDAIIQKVPCKVITCTTNEVMLAAYLVKYYYPEEIEIISVIHNSNEKVYEEYRDFRECSDLYIGVSKDIRNHMIEQGVRSDMIYSMTCPFECEPMLVRSYSEEKSQSIRIGFAGRMEYHQKRMDLLLKLIGTLIEKKINFRMEFAGDGIARKEMEMVVQSNQWEDKIRFLGRLDRSMLSDFWKRQDICVNLADFEGRSISIIEAMGNGAVPIVTETSGVREDITDSVNGFIVPVGDYQTAAERIEYLSRCREQLRKMGEVAHDAVYPKSLMKPHFDFWKKILFYT